MRGRPKRRAAPTATPDALGGPAGRLVASGFDEITSEADGDALILTHARDEPSIQALAMGFSTSAFIIFVIIVLPALQLTQTGRLLWILVGLVLLAAVGLATQARTRTTTIRADSKGVKIDQGTPMDREHIVIAWGEMAGVELEPVNPKDARKGMQMRIMLRTGAPIDTLENAGIGDLTEVRRILLDQRQFHLAKAAT